MSEHRLCEIVIERPRHGMRCSARRLKGVRKPLNRLTEIAAEDGLLSPYLIKTWKKTKGFSDHLGPLRRLLRSKVNQPWNATYSELCQRLDPNTLAGQHVLSHLWQYVERHVELVDGIPYRKNYLGYGWRPLGCGYRDEFYIHPETGMLCLAGRSPHTSSSKPTAQPQSEMITIDAYRYYQKLNEVWYLIILQNLPTYEVAWDVVLKTAITPELAQRKYGRKVYASRKLQCSKRLLKVIADRLKH